jgi:phosphatidylinositol-3-phosphatase
MKHHAFLLTIVAILALPTSLTCYRSGALAQESASPSSARPARPEHVFIIVLENEGFDTTFGEDSPAPYLSRELTQKGLLLTQYYGIGHFSLDNYIAMISGQAPNAYTQNDCFTYYDFKPLTVELDPNGQALGAGCVYPESVTTLPNQLDAKHLAWKAYMEDMDTNCEHPALGQPDKHIHATAQSQYATRHNPFVYFHSIIDHPTCAEHVVPLTQLDKDLGSIATTPNLSFITPNVCHDGHDRASNLCAGGHLTAVNRFLPTLVPGILDSPAYKHDGMLIITFDEADIEINAGKVVPEKTDASACCDEPTGPNTVAPGRSGPGGGRIGALIISPYVEPGRDDQPYNHYSLLRSLEDLFGLEHLGYAAQPGLKAFGDDVYNAPVSSATSTPH